MLSEIKRFPSIFLFQAHTRRREDRSNWLFSRNTIPWHLHFGYWILDCLVTCLRVLSAKMDSLLQLLRIEGNSSRRRDK